MMYNTADNMTYDEIMESMVFYEKAVKKFGEPKDFTLASAINELYGARDEYNKLMNEIAISELKQLSLYGEVAIFEAATGSAGSLWDRFISAAKAFFARLYEAISKAWTWAIKNIDTFITANGLFVSKYNKLLGGISSIEYENGYKFNDLEPPTVYKTGKIDSDVKDLDNPTANANEIALEKDNIIKTISNGKIVSANAAANITEAFKDLYYGPVIPSDVYDIHQQLEYIKSCNADKKSLNVAFKAAIMELDTIKHLLNTIKPMQTDKQANRIVTYIELAKYNAEVLYVAHSTYVKAIIDRTNQARAICIKALYDQVQHNSTVEEVEPVKYHSVSESVDTLYNTLC